MTKQSEQNSESKSKLNKTHKRILISFVIVIILFTATSLAWLYNGNLTQTKQNIFSKVPLPIAFVQSKAISSTELFDRIAVVKKLYTSAGKSTQGLENQLLDQLIEIKKIKIVASNNNVSASSDEIEASYRTLLKEFPDKGEEGLKQELEKSFGLDLKTFKSDVIVQTVLIDNLSLWFNTQESLNSESYLKAREIIKQLDDKVEFEEVAKKNSDDYASKDFAGDNGFIKYSDLLPEFQKGLEGLAVGDTKLLVSRSGLHILKVNGIEEASEGEDKSYNLSQIFVKPGDFQKWLKEETAKIKSVKLLK